MSDEHFSCFPTSCQTGLSTIYQHGWHSILGIKSVTWKRAKHMYQFCFATDSSLICTCTSFKITYTNWCFSYSQIELPKPLNLLSPPRDVPKTRVGQDSMRAVRPFKKIWCKKSTVSLFRKIELMSSCVQGGFLLLAAILKGLRKHEIRISNCSTYSSSASTIRNTKLKLELNCKRRHL